MSLETNAGIYNLLELQNNVNVVLANQDSLQAGYVSQMRLILGENNTITVDSVTLDLSIPSAQNSGLKLNLDTTLEAGQTYQIILDFNAEQSIIEQGNGTYKLKPVISVQSITQI